LTLLVDGMELNFTIDDANIKARISKITSPDVVDMNLQIGEAVKENVKIHVGKMSVPRHKTADRLGAGHSGFYENAVGRVILKEVSQDGAVVEIQDTPGLSRAFHDLHITPKRAKWLTIPIHRESYGKRVADLRGMGHKIFRPGKARILAETTTRKEKYIDKDGKTRTRAKLRPLYALVKSVRIPQDKGLLPQRKEIMAWAQEKTEDYLDSFEALL
jgi:hypothetical protein